jgi:Cu2+-exporting ATPase
MFDTIENVELCGLCQLPLPHFPIVSETIKFCCSGCQSVYSILSAKGVQGEYQEDPLFLQAVHYGLISNPLIIEKLNAKSISEPEITIQRLYFEINEMWCPSCAELIRLLLLQEKGIKSCVVDYATDLAIIEYAPQWISQENIFKMIGNLGYRPQMMEKESKKGTSLSLYLRFIIAAFCSLNVMMFAYPLYATYFDYDEQGVGSLFAWLSLGVSLPVVFYSAWPIYRRFASGLLVGLYGMEALVTISVAAAFGISLYELTQEGTRVYFDSLCVVITFVLLGKIIENKAKFSAKQSLFRLSRSLPKRGRRLQPDGTVAYLPVKDIEVGDILQVLMGETIVLDGVVVEGEGLCNEALMTGEPQLLVKSAGDKVIAGSILQQGNIRCKVSAKAEASILQRIVNLIEQDIGRKSSYVRAADAIVRWFIPLILMLATLVSLSWYIIMIFHGSEDASSIALLNGVTLLLIACPCALGIAAPLAESYLIDVLTSQGVVVRNRGALKFLGQNMTYVFDKTGTLTEGRLELLSGIEKLSDWDKEALQGLVKYSNHPTARAIAAAISEIPAFEFDRVEEFAGKGLQGTFKEKISLLGSSAFLKLHGIQIEEQSSSNKEIVSHVYFTNADGRIFLLSLGDRLRAGAKEMIDQLSPSQTVLLSGDSENCVAAVASECGFKTYYAAVGPLDKREKIEALKRGGATVCMIGDGINDAPALTAAHVGVSVVNASDISIQVSDILLTTDKLEVIPEIISLARFGKRIISQNLFWAFFYNVIGIALAAFGLLSPIFAAFAMTISSIIVLLNASRLKRRI